MIPKNTSKIVLFLLKNINQFGYNINQISKLNKISVGSAFKILKELEKNEIIYKTKINNASNYKLNFENPETRKLSELLLLGEKRNLKGYAKIYADEIIKFKDSELIIMFGSVLKGNEFNDVDVLFVTNQTKKVIDFCLDISKIRTKPVVPLLIPKKDLINEIKNEKEIVLNILKNGVIIKGESSFIEIIINLKS